MSGAASVALAVASGGALTLAFPEAGLAPVAWLAPAGLFVALRRASLPRSFTLGFVFGLGFFGTLLVWITHVGYAAWIGAVVLESLFTGLFALAWNWCSARRGTAVRIIAAVVLWVALVEYLRSLVPAGGFTWGQLAQSQTTIPGMLGPARFGGGWATAAIVIAAAACFAETIVALSERARSKSAGAVAVGIATLALALVVPRADSTGPPVTVAIVQGNVPLDIPRGFERDLAIIQSHLELTRALAGTEVDLVVWPESAVGIDPDNFPEVAQLVADGATAAGVPMIVGATLDVDEDRYRVVALLVSAEGRIVDRYQKTHLVPFGEYVPARGALSWLPMLDQVPRDAVAGSEHRVFEVAGGTVAPVVSFEGDFGSLVRKPVANGGRLLVVATNTSTWGHSWASAQHVAFSRVRAVENGVWVAHGALSGISAFIRPDGTVVSDSDLWTRDTLVATLAFTPSETFYTRYGDWLPWACLLASVYLIALGFGGRRERDGTVSADD